METAKKILQKLEDAGHKAYIVGGAVRDMLMGIPEKDIDIVSTAAPPDICAVAKSNKWAVHEVGLVFGVVVVVVEGKAFEVTSARRERYGRDSHKPEWVSFVQDIKEDLSRRDFTINAMAMDSSGKLVDPFGGQEDIQRKIIRAVGSPEKRFAEDGLRPFRAIRFAAQLGFDIDRETLAAIPGSLHRVSGLSVERVRGELEKILVSTFPSKGLNLLLDTGLMGAQCTSNTGDRKEYVGILPELVHLKGLEQNPRYHHFDVWDHTLGVVDNVPPETELRWAALLHDSAKGIEGVRCLNKRGEPADYGHDRVGAEIARKILTRFKVPWAVKDRVVWLVRNHMALPAVEYGKAQKWLVKKSRDFASKDQFARALRQLLLLRKGDIAGGKVRGDFSEPNQLEKLFQDILRETPFYTADLAVDGGEVARQLGAGPQVKEFLDDLLLRVQKGEIPNDSESLRKALKNKEIQSARSRGF